MIDTHAHLDAAADPADVLVERARAAGVDRIVSVGTKESSWHETLAIAERHDGVAVALGIHPHEAADGDVGALRDALQDVDREDDLVDFRRPADLRDRPSVYGAKSAQEFVNDRRSARETRKPVVIHTRAADDDTQGRLLAHDGDVVLHCFSSPALLPAALERGWYVSFAGNVTYKNAHDLRSAAYAVPAERLLAETDSPYLAPVPRRGRPNEPANVVHTVAALAHARNDDAAELAAQIETNARRCFDL